MDLKIILILMVLVGIVLVICWYSCPSRQDYNIPWRPKEDNYKAPNPGFYYPVDEYPSGGPYIGCSESQKITIYWVCDYSTTIYKPEFVHFNLTADIQLPSEWSGIIDGNISPSDTSYTGDTLVYYTYTYQTDSGDIPPGSYTLHLNSFVPQSENIPNGQKADSDITDGSMIVYNSQVEEVKNITINDDEGETDQFNIGDDIIVKWDASIQSFPPPKVSYRVSLVDDTGEESNICVVEDTSHTYSSTDLIGTYTSLVKTINDDCDVTSAGRSSEPFTVDYPPVPIPVITKSESACSYVNTIETCSDQVITLYWCMDFSESPEYCPKTSGDPDFTIYITGDSVSSIKLNEVTDCNVDGNIYYYSYTFTDGADAGNYIISITANTAYKGGDKYLSDRSKPTFYAVYQKHDQPYLIPEGTILYDRDPPVYTTNDVMKLSWDAPDTTGVYPTPYFSYNWRIDSNDFSCATTTSRQTTINLKSGATKSCSPPTYSIATGSHSFLVEATDVSPCGSSDDKGTTHAPNFIVVDCLQDGDCSEGLVCDTDGLTYGSCVTPS